MIGELVAADPAIPKSGPKEWKAQITLLKHDIRVLRARMEAVAAGQPYRPFPPADEWQYPPPGPPPAPTPLPTSAAARGANTPPNQHFSSTPRATEGEGGRQSGGEGLPT